MTGIGFLIVALAIIATGMWFIDKENR